MICHRNGQAAPNLAELTPFGACENPLFGARCSARHRLHYLSEVDMLKRLGPHSDSMLLALLIWLCSLPLTLFIVASLFGLTAAGIVVLLLFFVVFAICW